MRQTQRICKKISHKKIIHSKKTSEASVGTTTDGLFLLRISLEAQFYFKTCAPSFYWFGALFWLNLDACLA